jgi:hypothetical protein
MAIIEVSGNVVVGHVDDLAFSIKVLAIAVGAYFLYKAYELYVHLKSGRCRHCGR